jgi:hypothetical protein
MAINVGTLALDGPETPHQLAMILPITGTTDSDAVATCRYRKRNTASPSTLSQSGSWVTAHNLYRIRTDLSDTPSVGSVENAFAWTIIGLDSNTPYDVEVTVSSAGDSDVVKSATVATRRLPPRAGKPNKTITAGSSSSTIQTAFNGLAAGDVIEFENGSYTLSGITITANGSSGSPIYIRGQSREGVILTDTTGAILDLNNCDYLVIENLSLVGSGSDSGTSASSIAVLLNDTYTHDNITIRNITASGIDKFVVTHDHEVTSVLVYNCVAVGNNLWNATFLGDNRTWNDDCLQLAGSGNCAFRNTLKNFGDTFAYSHHSLGVGTTYTYNVHFYLNDVWNSCDDLAEVDEAHRNLTMYDNRCHNAMTLCSLDQLYGGPFICARNILFNCGRDKTVKCGGTNNSGYFLYANTVVGSGSTASNDWTLYQNEGTQESFGFQNNLFVFRSTPQHTVTFDAAGYTTVDFTNNAFYPDGDFWWESAQGNLSTTYSTLAAVTPIFSGQTKRHQGDVITVSDPFTTNVTLGTVYTDPATEQTYPAVNDSSVVNAGVEIKNITPAGDTTPNIGAVMDDFMQPVYGNRLPQWVRDLDIGEWVPLASGNAVMSGDEVVTAWNGAALDTGRSWLLSVAAGGHGDGSGNAIYALKLFQTTPAWETLLPDTASTTANVTHYGDGRPVSRHTYYGIQFDEWNDRVMIFGGSRYQDGGLLSTTDSYNIGANSYNPVSTHANMPSGTVTYGFASTYDPRTGNIYALHNQVLSLWTRSSNTWSTPSYTGGTVWGRNAMSAVDISRDRVYFQGGDDTDNHYCNVAGTAFTTVTLTGARAAELAGMGQAGMVYVPELDVFLVRNQPSGGDIIQINASTYDATTFSTTGGAGIQNTDPFTESGDGQGVYNKFIYVPELGGCVYLNGFATSTYFLRAVDVEPAIPGDSGGAEIKRGSQLGGLG